MFTGVMTPSKADDTYTGEFSAVGFAVRTGSIEVRLEALHVMYGDSNHIAFCDHVAKYRGQRAVNSAGD